MRLIVAVVGLLQLLPVPSEPVSVYLGAVPSAEGFVAGAGSFEDSYADLRKEFERSRELGKIMRLVSAPAEAVLILEVTDRGLIDTGLRSNSAVATGPNTAVGSSVPVRVKQLFVRLAVPGTDYRLEIDGAAGIRLKTYRNQAKNVLQQAADWIQANRAKLDAR